MHLLTDQIHVLTDTPLTNGIQDYVKQTAEQVKTQEVEEFDDGATVVDMNYVTTTTNPADQKYKRFQFLVCAKNDLVMAVKTNSALLQANLNQLDEDDVLVVKKEIESAQHQLNLVNNEIREINQWFQEMNAQRQSFYEQFLQKSHDVSGDLKNHFQKKMENIQKYIQETQKQ